jgi:hypothetical protein
MNEITYSYKIIAVDKEARCMEVIYTSEGYPTMHIGARLPFENESLEDVIAIFSPVAYWRENRLNVTVPDIGANGLITAPSTIAPTLVLAAQPSSEGAQEM